MKAHRFLPHKTLYTGVFDTAMSSKFALDLQALPL